MSSARTLHFWLEQFRVRDVKDKKGEGGDEAESDKKGKPADVTHYSLVGGKFNIPTTHHAEWLRLYADHLQRCREPLFFIELRTPIFRMHFDIDLIQPTVATLTDIVTMVRVSCNAMKRFYPDTSVADYNKRFTAIVLKSPSMSKGTWDDDGARVPPIELFKTGFHIIWPFLLVSQQIALTLREACVVDMVRQLPARDRPSNSYDDVVDECVLTDNGLRMMGSDKARGCEICKGKARNPSCGACIWGKVAENRVYAPFCVFNEHGELDEQKLSVLTQQEDVLTCVRVSSIRSFVTEPAPGFQPPPLAPMKDVETVLTLRRRKLQHGKGGGQPSPAVTEGVKWLHDASDLPRGCVVFNQVQQFLQQRMGRVEWAEVMVKRFMFSSTTERYFVKVWGDGSHWCTNVQRMHYSSTIYFVISRNGISQKCFCKKKNADVQVQCGQYSSPAVKLTKVLALALFDVTEEEMVAQPAPLVAPVTSVKPFVPHDEVAKRVKTKYIDLSPCLAILPTMNPALVVKQQLAAQQAAQRLSFAIQQRERGQGKVGKKRDEPSKAVSPIPSSPVTPSKPSAHAAEMVRADTQRQAQQATMVEHMRAELHQRGIVPPPLKKPRKNSKA
jgi:hypothetical protein